MAASLDEDDDILKNDYYALLNVSKDASVDEINNAFRHLSKIYHPDKHVNPERKKKAEEVFTKLRKAHDILRDKSTRAVYDMFGEKGLEQGDMEVIAKTKTPAEIMAEYERIQKEREQRRLNQRTNPRGSISVSINATDLFDIADDDEEFLGYEPSRSVEISSMSISQSVECPLTLKDTMVVGGNLDTRNGIGQGMFSIMWRRLISTKGWSEVDLHLGTTAALGLNGFYQLSQRCYFRCGGRIESTQRGYRPSANFMLAYQFDRNIQGRLTYNLSTLSSMSSLNTTIVYSNEQNHLSTTLQLGVRSSYFSMTYFRTFLEQNMKLRGHFKVGTMVNLMECSVEKKITDFSHVGGTLLVGLPIGVHLKIKITRGQQSFIFPIHLSEELSPSAIMYGTIIPIASYFVIRKLIVNPFLRQQKQKEMEKQKEEYAEKLALKKEEAAKAVELMKETYDRSVEIEEKKSGLVIMKALYGKLLSSDDGEILEHTCIDVTIPIQALVKESKLILPETSSKSGLPGFYDPFIGEDKKMYIRYKFRNRLHQVFLSDVEPIRLPQQKHLMQVEEPHLRTL